MLRTFGLIEIKSIKFLIDNPGHSPSALAETPRHSGPDGGQTQEAQPQGVAATAAAAAHQPSQALRPSGQQERHLLPRPAAASLPKEPRQVQEVHRGAGAAEGGVYSGRRRSAQNHQVCVWAGVLNMCNKCLLT